MPPVPITAYAPIYAANIGADIGVEGAHEPPQEIAITVANTPPTPSATPIHRNCFYTIG